jgi:PII-like signaling protein
MKAKISGATAWTGIDDFGRRKRSTVHLEGLTVNMPLLIEIIDEKTKLEPLLPKKKRMVNDNALITLQEVDVI